MSVRKDNGKCYLTVDRKKVDQYAIDQFNKPQDVETDIVEFEKEHPYITH